jgi:hypothetical protein
LPDYYYSSRRLSVAHECLTRPKARYYGIEVSEKTLVPDDGARLGETRFETWLTQSAAKAAAGTH